MRTVSHTRITSITAVGVLTMIALVMGSMTESQAADGFWRSRKGRFFSSARQNYVAPAVKQSAPKKVKPATGYSANLHRNFVIRQQQQRTESGGSLIYRGNIFWHRW